MANPNPNPNPNFEVWVKENGGDDDLIDLLKVHGFTSKLSISNLDFESPESSNLISQFNYGQKCLIKGLVKLLNRESSQSMSTPYTLCASKANAISKCVSNSNNLREKIGKLFHFDKSNSHGQNSSEMSSFSPSSAYPKKGLKRKGPISSKLGPVKKKVKQIKLKVVALQEMRRRTPCGSLRDELTHHLWLNYDANEQEVKEKLIHELGWHETANIQYLYAQGKNLRIAQLCDVENAESWDLETLRVLMGSGALYVLKSEPEKNTDAFDSKSCEKETTIDADKLAVLFKNVPINRIKEILQQHDLDEAIEILLVEEKSIHDKMIDLTNSPPTLSSDLSTLTTTSSDLPTSSDSLPGPSTSYSDSPVLYSELCHFSNVEDLLFSHSLKVVDSLSEYNLTVDCSTSEHFWLAITSFYKGAISKPQKLRKSLVVNYIHTGEVGSDSGALRKEFFEDGIREVNSRLFEGDDNRRVPKKDLTLETLFEIAGMLVAHSISHEGPGIPCLSPCVFQYLVNGNIQQCYPNKDDIPLNISTHELITLIEELDNATTEEEIDTLFDKPSYQMILNSSRWSIIEAVDNSNKCLVQQQLILEEVLIRREANLQAFSRGLDVLGVAKMIQNYPDLLRLLFVAHNCTITSAKFKDLVQSSPIDSEEERAYQLFIEFIDHIEEHSMDSQVSLPCLLRFITGMSSIPPMGMSLPIEIKYHVKNSSDTLPTSSACMNKLFLPVCHITKESFFSAFVTALKFGSGFGSV